MRAGSHSTFCRPYRPGAIYYTEVEEVSDADLYIHDTFRFYLGRSSADGK